MIRNTTRSRRRATLALAMAVTALSAASFGDEEPLWWDGGAKLVVTSDTFKQNGALPDSMIYNDAPSGVNLCTANGALGADKSPQLSWKHVPPNTRSFVVVLYDPTAAFTHWGMYNISGSARSLPENAGVPARIHIELGGDLDTELRIKAASVNFPAGAETLYHALIHAARDGHILGSGSIGTYYSSTPAN